MTMTGWSQVMEAIGAYGQGLIDMEDSSPARRV